MSGHKFMLISPAVVMAATYESHSLQNSSTASFFLHTEDFNRANPSSSNHCKRTFTDIQEILLTCDMGIAWNVGRRGVTDGTTSTDRGVGYAYAVTRNSWEGSSFVHNDGRNHRRLRCYSFHYIFLQKRGVVLAQCTLLHLSKTKTIVLFCAFADALLHKHC